MIKEALDKNTQVKSNSREVEILKKYFPQCFDVSGNFDIGIFEEIVKNDEINITREGFSLNFLGKSYARYLASLDSETVIVPDKDNKDSDSENVYIVGDNLDALQHLKYSYTEKIKCIYIDPPYNTGTDGFVYNDKFDFTAEELAQKIGIEEEEAERVLNMQGQSTHSAWLTFMYPRLELAHDLLKDDGVIFISIDDNEQANCKLLCDSVFGEGNFIAKFVWAAGKKNDSRYVSVSHEYIYCYVKNKDLLISRNVQWKQRKQGIDEIYKQFKKITKKYKSIKDRENALREWYGTLPKNSPILNHKHYKNVDERGIYFPSDISWPGGGGPTYEVLHPVTHKPVAIPSRGWVFPTVDRMNEMIAENKIHFGADETSVPCIKTYLSESEYEPPYSVFYKDGRAASKRLKKMFDGKQVFENPKDEEIINELFDFISLQNNDIVLDFFGGSSTTAHAVMAYNIQHENANIKYIMVQLAESVKEGSDAEKAGYKTIDEIGRERIRRVAKKIAQENPEKELDLEFKTYYLKATDKQTLDKIAEFNPLLPMNQDDIKTQFGVDTILDTWKIRDGYGFNVKVQEVDLKGYSAYLLSDSKVGTSLYLIDGMPDNAIVELVRKIEACELNVDRIIEYGYSFDHDSNTELRSNLKMLKNRNAIDLIIRY